MQTINEIYKNSKANSIKTHLSCGCGGIDGFYSAEELRKWYGDCKAEIVEYEKDYGDGACVIRSYLKIYTDVNYDDEISAERKYNETK